MGSIYGDESVVSWDGQDSTSGHEEKIFVAVRLRPLNDRELAKNDVSDWECINNTTIIFKNTLHERSMLPTAYAFDRVFGNDSPTKQVYEEAAKKIVLSVLSGMNSTIFAYGQTSSGKTYTMTGITEYTLADIFDYISNHQERDFILKFSAMEIYNELVKDLLCSDGTPLRLLDDPERGTVVDKLTEVVLRDFNHLKELLSTCETQRQIGETTLNELSSRSHQILRLTVESEAREYVGALNSSTLTASVNFVDLAGSERASQTLSAGTRLKEGCHINRSLLTLGTVIRKLSKGRNGHIPYRDSKLTRILQSSLGGNARTAIICTMSPAHTHLEQSRNTLLFASCAKQVSTSAQVNVVMSEKALVKQLQRELARLENELRNLSSLSASGGSTSALKEKELLIEKMDKEMKELIHQRDLAQSRVQDMLRSSSTSKSWVDMNNSHEKGSWTDEYPASEASEIIDPLRFDVASRTSYISDKYEGAINPSRIEDQFLEHNEEQFLSDDTSPRLYIDKYFGPDPCKGWEKMAHVTDKGFEDNCKEVQCIDIDFTKSNMGSSESSPQKADPASGYTMQSPCSSDIEVSDTSLDIPRSRSCAAIMITVEKSPSLEAAKEKENENRLQNEADNQEKLSTVESVEKSENLSTKESQSPIMNENIKTLREDSMEKKHEDCVKELSEVIKPKSTPEPVKQVEDDFVRMIKPEPVKQVEDNSVRMIKPEPVKQVEDNFVRMIKPEPVKQVEKDYVRMNKPEPVKQVEDDLMTKPGSVKQVIDDSKEMKDAKTPNEPEKTADYGSPKAEEKNQYVSDWYTEFERQRRDIIELWNACNIPLVHRTYFFLLFKGDPSDAVYMEVELRRLSFLKNTLHGVRIVKDDQFFTQASSLKALNREREMLSKRMLKKFSAKEREALFQKWGIYLKSKQRRLQLCRRLWTDITNMERINESAAIVAKLVGFKEPGQAPKEMFGLSYSPDPTNLRSSSWRHSLPM
ncbi:hypothetical protein BUALT_Bualt08G0078900 [Buddleja alternifolia]|uniref:Kinesin-like protein n=1 Tax=Buddleja alternifolia TaxID=168488 RepID=A0AAV6XFL0_9LAMI|nr:hypothetical protein BUALT_Bualt08G0078900 [Buddleja alternifolia]